MAYLNEVKLIGNLTREPEFRQAGKSQLAEVGLAINRKFLGSDGTKKEETTFVNVTFWGKNAELFQRFQLPKGTPLYIDARLKDDAWEDKTTGQPRRKLVLVGESFQILGSRSGGNRSEGGQNATPSYTSHANNNHADSDDIPF